MKRAAIVLILASVLAPAAGAQRASRPADDWIATLEAPEIDRNFFPHIQQKAKAAGVTNVQTLVGEATDPKLPEPVDLALLHDVLHHIDNPAAYFKSLSKYLKPTGRIVIVDYLAKQGPHRDDPSLQVGKEEAAKLLAAIGFKPVDDVALFPDKYFVIYRR